MKTSALLVAPLLLLVACGSADEPAARPSDTGSPLPSNTAVPTSATAPTPSVPVAVPEKGLRAYPPLEDSCTQDGDCGLVDALRTDEPSSVGCCAICDEYTAGTKSWADKSQAACKAAGPCNLPSSCMKPAAPDAEAKCVKGKCTAHKIKPH